MFLIAITEDLLLTFIYFTKKTLSYSGMAVMGVLFFAQCTFYGHCLKFNYMGYFY
ncbi:hypothetical protein SAMN05660742_10922 [Propionispira arboris]|uniref:Uncharacterized protein n=1 Tax=Propionispira arboris TaxID=84035 RepID=A0A1H6ZAD8_9FIRM|nr:hypothetical protein SAMN05660742_10922 [Propionispira arboris]